MVGVEKETEMDIKTGSFVRVKTDHWGNRAGKDGMVMSYREGDEFVGLVFGNDRHNNPQDCVCVGTELWLLDELDLTTLEA